MHKKNSLVTPRYYFFNDFKEFLPLCLKYSSKIKHFKAGDIIANDSPTFQSYYYILNGIGVFYYEHETGREKIFTFHGENTIYPLYHSNYVKIDTSLFFKAITDMTVIVLSKDNLETMIEGNLQFTKKLFDLYIYHVNLLIYDFTSSAFESSYVKICNFLYISYYFNEKQTILFYTQDEIAAITGFTRVQVSRVLQKLYKENIILIKRKEIDILDNEKLLSYCSEDARPVVFN